MNSGQLFESLIRKMLQNAGFSSVATDNLHVFNSAPGQMIQGLGQAHNADVLMTPPVQTPFYYPSRILFECKSYKHTLQLNVIRSALGLREDINAFEVVDKTVLMSRRNYRRKTSTYNYQRYYYQVGVASLHGFSLPAQEFARAHRIPLISFDKLPFWNKMTPYLEGIDEMRHRINKEFIDEFDRVSDCIAKKFAVAMLEDGQMLFLYSMTEDEVDFPSDYYSLNWTDEKDFWKLCCGDRCYAFQLPEKIREGWLKNSIDEISKRKSAINCKEEFMSHMVVYFSKYGSAKIKMLTIDREQLKNAYEDLIKNNHDETDI